MKSSSLIIDLGSAFTRFINKQGYVLKEPNISIISGENSKFNIVAFGDEAKNFVGKHSINEEIYLPFNECVVKNITIAEEYIKHCLKKMNLKLCEYNCAYVAIPCGATGYDKQQITQIMFNCGILHTKFVPSAVCVCESLGSLKNGAKARIIVDIGASKTDVAVVANNKIYKGCTISIGGYELDKAVIDFVLKAYNVKISASMAEKIRIEAGSLFPNDNASYEFSGYDLSNKIATSQVVFSKDLRLCLENYYSNIHKTIETLLNMCSSEIVEDIYEVGVDLVGGASNINGISNYLTKKLRLKINQYKKHEDFVVKGLCSIVNNDELLNTVLTKN